MVRSCGDRARRSTWPGPAFSSSPWNRSRRQRDKCLLYGAASRPHDAKFTRYRAKGLTSARRARTEARQPETRPSTLRFAPAGEAGTSRDTRLSCFFSARRYWLRRCGRFRGPPQPAEQLQGERSRANEGAVSGLELLGPAISESCRSRSCGRLSRRRHADRQQ